MLFYLYFVLHNYRKAGDKTNESLDKRLVAPPSKVVYGMLFQYKNFNTQLILQSFYHICVYLLPFTCINFVSGF